MKIKIYLTIGLVILSSLLYLAYNNIKKLKIEQERLNYNIENINFDLDSTKTKNGELLYSLNSLQIKSNELNKYNSDLNQQIEDLNIKIKNLSQITKPEIEYIYEKDTVSIEKLSDTTFVSSIKDDYISLSQKIDILYDDKNIKVYDLKLKLTDSLLILNEYIYKRKYIFFKKIVGNKIHIKSTNPYFHLNKVETYMIQND